MCATGLVRTRRSRVTPWRGGGRSDLRQVGRDRRPLAHLGGCATLHFLRRRGIPHTIPERVDQILGRLNCGTCGGRPPGFDRCIPPPQRRRTLLQPPKAVARAGHSAAGPQRTPTPFGAVAASSPNRDGGPSEVVTAPLVSLGRETGCSGWRVSAASHRRMWPPSRPGARPRRPSARAGHAWLTRRTASCRTRRRPRGRAGRRRQGSAPGPAPRSVAGPGPQR
jgi:hypothetical protein